MAPFLHLILILSILCFNTLAETVPTAKAKSANLPGGPQGFCVPSDVVSWPQGKEEPIQVSVPSGCRKLALGRFVKFGDSGALALSRILGDPYDNVTAGGPMTLLSLDLRGTSISDAGAAVLARSLLPISGGGKAGAAGPGTIEDFVLAHNQVGDSGAAALAVMLRHNKVMNALNLANNRIGDQGASALAAALSTPNGTLEELYLEANPIGLAGALALSKMLDVNKGLLEFSYYDLEPLMNPATQARLALDAVAKAERVASGILDTDDGSSSHSSASDESTPSVPALEEEEATFFTELFAKYHNSGESSGLSLKLLKAAGLSTDAEARSAQTRLLEFMDSNNDNQASSAEFLTFLRIHPVGVLARAARRRRIRGGFDPKLEAGAAEAVAKEERRKALEKEKSLKLQAENALKKKEMIAKRAREQELELLNGSPTTRKSAHQVRDPFEHSSGYGLPSAPVPPGLPYGSQPGECLCHDSMLPFCCPGKPPTLRPTPRPTPAPLPTPQPSTFFSTVFKQQLKKAGGSTSSSDAATTGASTTAGAGGTTDNTPTSKDKDSPAYKSALATAEAAALKHAIAKERRARKARYALYWPVEKMRAAYVSLQQQRARALGLPPEKKNYAEEGEEAKNAGGSYPSPLPGARGFGGRKQDGEPQERENHGGSASKAADVPTPWKKIEKFPSTLPVLPAKEPLSSEQNAFAEAARASAIKRWGTMPLTAMPLGSSWAESAADMESKVETARLALSKGASGTESPPMRGDPTEGVLIVTPAEVAAATFLATKAKAYTSVPEDPGVDGLNANEEETPLGNGVPITAGGRGSSQWPSFAATAVGRANPNVIPWLTWLLHDGNLHGAPAYTQQEINSALIRLGGNAESCPEFMDCVARLFVAAKRIEKDAWASQQWWSETFGKGAPRRQASEILTRFRKFLPPPPESPSSEATSTTTTPSSSTTATAAATTSSAAATSTHVEESKAIVKEDVTNICPPRNGLANETLNGWRWRHPLRAPLPFHVSAGGQYPLGREALQASLINRAAYNDARLQKFFRKALRGERVTVVVLGGSMTAGHSAGHPFRGEEEWNARNANKKKQGAGNKGGPPEVKGGCWLHCSPGHASGAAWPQKVVDWVRAAVAPAGTPPPGGDYSFDQGGFPDFNHETHGGGVMASQVKVRVHATGAVTSAYSMHVILDEYMPKQNGTVMNQHHDHSQKDGGEKEGDARQQKNDATKEKDAIIDWPSIDLVLVDHSANDLSLRSTYVSEEVKEMLEDGQRKDPRGWWAAERANAFASATKARNRHRAARGLGPERAPSDGSSGGGGGGSGGAAATKQGRRLSSSSSSSDSRSGSSTGDDKLKEPPRAYHISGQPVPGKPLQQFSRPLDNSGSDDDNVPNELHRDENEDEDNASPFFSASQGEEWRPLRLAVESLYRAVLSLPQQPALVQFVGLAPRTRLSEEYGGGMSGGSLAQFLPQMESVASHYQVPLVAYYEAVTYEGVNCVDAPEVRAEQAYREGAEREAMIRAAASGVSKDQEGAQDLGVSGLRRAKRRQLLLLDDSKNANDEISMGGAKSWAERRQKEFEEASESSSSLQKRRLASSSLSTSGAAQASEAVAAARASALAEKAAAIALGWKGAWHEARRSKRKEKAEDWALMQARGEVGQAVLRATLEQSLSADDDGTVKQFKSEHEEEFFHRQFLAQQRRWPDRCDAADLWYLVHVLTQRQSAHEAHFFLGRPGCKRFRSDALIMARVGLANPQAPVFLLDSKDPLAQNLTVYLERVAASRVFPPMKNTEPILHGGGTDRLLPFGTPPSEMMASSFSHKKGITSSSGSSISSKGGLGGRWRVALELSEGVLAYRALNQSLYPGEYGRDTASSSSSSSGTTKASVNLLDKRGWSPVLHADIPKCHSRRTAKLSECMLLGIPGAVHPPGYVHQLFADAIVASVLHPALVQATSSASSACATSSPQAHSPPSTPTAPPRHLQSPMVVPPLPSPLDPAADPLTENDDVIASCNQPLTFFSAALSPPPFPYAFPKTGTTRSSGGGNTAAAAAAAQKVSRSGAVPFAPLSPPRGWAFGPDLAGKPAGWITPAERSLHHANLSAMASAPGITIEVGGLRLSADQHRTAAERAGETRTSSFTSLDYSNNVNNHLQQNTSSSSPSAVISFRALFLKGVLELSFLRTYRDAGKIRVRLTRPSEDSLNGFKLGCLGNLHGPSKVEIYRSSASRNKNRKDKGLPPLPLDDRIVKLGVEGLGQLSEAALEALAAAADPRNNNAATPETLADAAAAVAAAASSGESAAALPAQGTHPGAQTPKKREWFSGPPSGEYGCVVDIDSWRPSVAVSEVAHATIDFRAGPHESAAGVAVVTLEALPLSAEELSRRGGNKFKLMELRSC